MKSHSSDLLPRRIVTIALLSGLAAFSGCSSGSHPTGSGQSSPPPPTPATVKGIVRGGQVPVAGASLQLYAAGTTGDGSSATPLLTQPIASDASGNFAFTGTYTCPSTSSLVYVTASQGNPGLAAGTNNTASVLIAALGPCGSLPASFIVNEVTTVAAIWPLAPFMSSPSAIGSGAADAGSLSAAFTLAAEFADVTTGAAPGNNVPVGTTVPSSEINTIADILSACVNSGGGVAGDGSPCGQLFTLTTPAGGSAPATIAAAGRFIEQNPAQNTPQLFALLPANAPFLPMLGIPPVDWGLHPAVPSALSVTPSSISFSSTIVNFTAASQTITLRNSGSTDISISGIALTGSNAGDFTFNNSCTSTLPATQTCTIPVSFSPVATGSKYAYLTIANSATSEPVAIALTGMAVDGSGALSVSPTSLSFSQLSVPQTITLANSSASAIAIQSISLPNQNFTESNTCGNSVAANAGCTVSVTAAVANSDSATPLTATLTIVAGDTIGIHTVPLSTSIAPVPGPLVVSPGSLTFTTAGVPQSVTLTNSGSAVLTLQIIPPVNPTFVQINTCGGTLAPAANCTVSITANSLGATPLTSTLTIVANDAAGTHTVALSAAASGGTLPPISISPSSLAFPSTLLNFSSPAQPLTITNNTPDAIGYSLSFQGSTANNYTVTFPNTCPYPLQGGQSCTLQVAFAPVTAGAHNGAMEFSPDSGSPIIIPFTGTGVAGTGGPVTLSPSSLSFTQFGVPAPVTVTNTGSTAVAIGPVSVGSDGSYAQTNNCGSTLDPQSICTIEVSTTQLNTSFPFTDNLTVITGDATGIHTLPLSTPISNVNIVVPGPIAFGSWAVGAPSAPQEFYFTSYPNQVNYGLEITGPDANDFSFDRDSTVSSISGGGCGIECGITIYFTPGSLGLRTATLTTSFGIATLTGTGSPAGPSFVLSGEIQNPMYQVFGPAQYPVPVTVTNNGSTPLVLSAEMTGANAAQYTFASQCPATLAIGSTCIVQVTFAPNKYGSLPADLKVTDNTSGMNQTITFQGFGLYPGPSASPQQIEFGNVQIGSVSAPISTTVTAPGDHPVIVSGLSPGFGVTTTSCSATPCQIGVTFAPTAPGHVDGTIALEDVVTGTTSTYGISVSATGGIPAVSLSPSILTFSTRNTGSTSIAQVVTLTNSGNAPLKISTISIGGTNAADFVQSNNCSSVMSSSITLDDSIDAGVSCAVSISFAPTEVGDLSAALQILSNAPPAAIDLTGTATAPPP